MKALRFLLLGFWLIAGVVCQAEMTDPGWFRASPELGVLPPADAVPQTAVLPEQGGVVLSRDEGGTNASEIAEEITPEIQALAEGLGNDPARICNYVHDHIRYVLYFGSKKGAQLTLLERSGNDFDQSALLVALLRAAGYDSAAYQFGWMGIPYDNPDGSHRDLRHWLGLSLVNTNWAYTSNYLVNLFIGSRGYPTAYVMGDGNSFLFQRVWVRLPIDGTNYYLDPAFKVSEPVAGVPLATAMGFSSNALMSAAAGQDAGNYVTNLNESAVRNALAGYTTTLLGYLQSNFPNASVDEVLGGWRIVPSTNMSLSRGLMFTTYAWNIPGVAVMPIVDWQDQPTNLMSRLSIMVAGTNHQWFMPQLKGQRLALNFDANGLAQLWQDDTLLLEKTATGTGRLTNVVLGVDHPFGSWDFANNVLLSSGKDDQIVTNAYQRTNASYALIYAFEPNWNWLQKRQQQLAGYRASGLADDARQVVDETLNVMGLNWMLQSEWLGRILAAQTGMLSQQHHRLGRMAQEGGHGYYVDVYMQNTGDASGAGNDTAIADLEDRHFDLVSYFGSALEHGIIEQLQFTNLPGASTVKMLQLANTNSQVVYLASSTNWQTGFNVRGKLVNYNLSSLDSLINAGYRLLLPRNGSNQVAGVGSWAGSAYIARLRTANSNMIRMEIGGGYSGGYVSDPSATVNPPLVDLQSFSQPDYYNPFSPLVPVATGADPVNMADGSFRVAAKGLSFGGTEPRGVTFTAFYSPTRRNHNLAGIANGWVHNYYVDVAEVTAPQAGLGETTPAQMAPMLAATAAAVGIYNDLQPNPKNWLVTALIAKWGMDQLIKNGVSVSLGQETVQFVRQPDGSFTPPAGSTMTLLKTNAAYQLQQRHGNTFKFNAAGLLTNIVDQYNRGLNVSYDSSNRVQTVTDWKNRTLTLTYSGSGSQRLSYVLDDTGRGCAFGYSIDGGQFPLTGVIDPEGKLTAFRYDTNGLMTATLDAFGRIVTSNRYDNFGRVIEQYSRGDTNQIWRFFWTDCENVEQDPAGGRRTFYYDDNHRLTGVRDALGNLSQTFYDGQDHVVMTVSPLNETNRFVYDGRHNLTLSIDPLGFTNQFVYDGQNNLVKAIDPRGNTNSFGYNAQFSLAGQTNGAGDWVNYTYNGDGTRATRADAAGTTSYGYDSYGQLSSVTYPDGLGGESFVNSALGDVTSHTDARNFVTSYQYNLRRELTNTIAPTNVASSVRYDDAANVAATTDARGFTTSNLWSATKKRLATIYPATPQGTPIVTNIYDDRDWLAQTIDSLQQTTTYTNDAAQRLVSVTDPLQRTTRHGYDADNRRTATTNAAWEVSRQEWNARGGLTQATDGANRTVRRAYDGGGNLTLLTNRNGKVWQFQYDAANRLTNTISPLLRSTRQSYNHRGLLQSVIEPSTETTTFGYDAKGRLTNRVDAVGTNIYRYDANDNLTNVAVAGQASSLSSGFDAYNRISSYADADVNLIQYRWDANGNLTNLVYPGNRNVFCSYDSLNRLTNVTDWASRQTSFEYDLASRLRKITRFNGSVRQLDYDAAGQVTNIVEKLTNNFPIAFFRLNWNAAARLDWEFAAPLPHASTLPVRTMTFDDDNRLATFNGQSVVHDLDGNLTYGPGTNDTFVSYGYNARNQLLGAGNVSYSYDPQGNRTALTNGTNVVKFVVNPNAALPQVLMRIQPGVTNYYVYGLGLLYEVTETATSTRTLTYHYDYRGSTVALTDGSGVPTDRMEYSVYGTLTCRAGTNDTPFLFNGRFGVQTDPNGLLYMRARYYNPYLCRFLNADPSGFTGGLNFYAYADGNPVNRLDPFGLGAGDADFWSWIGNTIDSGADAGMSAIYAAGSVIQTLGNGADRALAGQLGGGGGAEPSAQGAFNLLMLLAPELGAASLEAGVVGEGQQLFRVVNNAERAGIETSSTFTFPPNGSTPTGQPGKFFWSSLDEAKQFQQYWYRSGEESHILQTTIGPEVKPWLGPPYTDGIGQPIFVEMPYLTAPVQWVH